MKVVMFLRSSNQPAAATDAFLADIQRRYPKVLIESIDPDSPRGSQLAELYDIVAYPAIIIATSDGQALEIWQGEQLPQTKELDYYLINA